MRFYCVAALGMFMGGVLRSPPRVQRDADVVLRSVGTWSFFSSLLFSSPLQMEGQAQRVAAMRTVGACTCIDPTDLISLGVHAMASE